MNKPTFLTIRQTAETGILSEYRLRAMEAEGRLPGIKAGNKKLVHFEKLVEYLNTISEIKEG